MRLYISTPVTPRDAQAAMSAIRVAQDNHESAPYNILNHMENIGQDPITADAFNELIEKLQPATTPISAVPVVIQMTVPQFRLMAGAVRLVETISTQVEIEAYDLPTAQKLVRRYCSLFIRRLLEQVEIETAEDV